MKSMAAILNVLHIFLYKAAEISLVLKCFILMQLEVDRDDFFFSKKKKLLLCPRIFFPCSIRHATLCDLFKCHQIISPLVTKKFVFYCFTNYCNV